MRQFYGAYDYWAEEQTLGNPGKVVYYATAVGSTPATNDPNKWIANQWNKFNPGLYDAANSTTDNYANVAPAYVMAAGGPGTYTGAPWEVHFSCTQAQLNQGQYVVLSVGLAANEASLTVTLNGHQEVWHFGGTASDAMVRSGVAGVYQFLAFQFPTSDLNSAGADNEFTFGVSQTDGVMYDALRMEITNTSASSATTGWNDYAYITGANTQTGPNNAAGLSVSQVSIVPGDFNRDGKLTAADVQSMLAALADLKTYQATNQLTNDELLAIGDLNGDSQTTNADIQGLIALLSNGGGSGAATAVSEPASILPLLIGSLLVATAFCRGRRLPSNRNYAKSSPRMINKKWVAEIPKLLEYAAMVIENELSAVETRLAGIACRLALEFHLRELCRRHGPSQGERWHNFAVRLLKCRVLTMDDYRRVRRIAQLAADAVHGKRWNRERAKQLFEAVSLLSLLAVEG